MKTILVIEDARAIRENLLRILGANGFRAIGAADGVTGLKQAQALRPDLVLCDIRMPQMDGYAVLQALRQDPTTATIALIFLSAKASRSELRQGMNLGADDYLTKPCKTSELLAAIAAILRKQAATAQTYLGQVQQAQAQMERLAYWDSLTNLPNRKHFCAAVQQTLDKLQAQSSFGLADPLPVRPLVRTGGGPGLVLFNLSINRLRTISITFGSATGEALIQAVGQRLKQLVKEGQLARLGEEDFGIFLTGILQQQQVAQFAQALIDGVTAPYAIEGQEVRIQASVGIASYPQHSDTPATLLNQANTAMRWCQRRGQSGYRFYSLTMTAIEVERHLIASDLSRAIERSEFQVYYQPQVDLNTGYITGIEALLRWHHPQRGMISPKTFIPIAEDLGLITPLGAWVLYTACAQVKRWHEQYGIPIKLSVNLSMRQFQHGNLVDTVAQVLQDTGLDPRLLILELTESSLMEQVNTTIATLQQLKLLGLEISIDDFGTGYSSLTYLSKLPIDSLKIDQTFVSQLTINDNAAVISNAIIAMAQQLRLNVVAEGVENQRQLDFLHDSGCRSVQGYFYSPPLNGLDFQSLLGQNRHRPFAIEVGSRLGAAQSAG
jgi:diguanylate cyclase